MARVKTGRVHLYQVADITRTQQAMLSILIVSCTKVGFD